MLFGNVYEKLHQGRLRWHDDIADLRGISIICQSLLSAPPNNVSLFA